MLRCPTRFHASSEKHLYVSLNFLLNRESEGDFSVVILYVYVFITVTLMCFDSCASVMFSRYKTNAPPASSLRTAALSGCSPVRWPAASADTLRPPGSTENSLFPLTRWSVTSPDSQDCRKTDETPTSRPLTSRNKSQTGRETYSPCCHRVKPSFSECCIHCMCKKTRRGQLLIKTGWKCDFQPRVSSKIPEYKIKKYDCIYCKLLSVNLCGGRSRFIVKQFTLVRDCCK